MYVKVLLYLFQTNIMMSLEVRSEWDIVIINETVFREITAFGLHCGC